ncbi:Heterokaryon incompatibility protein (HET) domain containing protein [Hyaloscypha variabilis]
MEPREALREGTRREGIHKVMARSAVARPIEGDEIAISGELERDLTTLPHANGMDILDQYHYIPLTEGTKAIRIMRLNPGERFESELSCEIITAELSGKNIPVYEAISYAWEGQSPDQNHFLVCHSKDEKNTKLLITKNCAEALRRFRRNDGIRALWIDAICIDQSSTQDRNHQVRIMGEIYARAQRVLIWLGEDASSNTAITLQLMRDLARSNPNNDEERRPLESRMKSICNLSDSPANPDVYGWNIYIALFERPWFKRMWTLQEIVLNDSNETTVTCGEHSITWTEIEKATRSISEMGWDQRCLISTTMGLYQHLSTLIMFSRDERNAQSRPPPVSSIFEQCRVRESTDPKDKVFALYGLCCNLDIRLPVPDYGKSLDQIYSQVTRALIDQDENLDVLYMVNTPRRLKDLPSWVPDWSDSWKKAESLSQRAKLSKLYHASHPKAFYSFDQDCKTLVVLAKIVDTVTKAGDAIPIFEENLGPRVQGIFDRTVPDWFGRNMAVWEVVQGWFRCFLGNEEEISTRYAGQQIELPFYYTMTEDLPTGAYLLRRSDPRYPLEAKLQDIKGFYGWYKGISGEKEFEKELLDRGLHMGCVLWTNEDRDVAEFHDSLWAFQRGKSFFTTKEGWIGTAEGTIREGDLIVLVAGLNMPLVLSPVGENYRLVGHGYVHGLMDGEQ